MLQIVYAKNSEQFLWENSEQFYLMQKTDFMNIVSIFEYMVNMMCRENFIHVETDFINVEKYIRLLWNSNMKRKHDFTRCFMRKQWTIF